MQAGATELSIELFCRGIRIDPGLDAESEGRRILRTRAGLGSGLEMCLPGRRKEQWINVPVLEPFARESPFLLTVRGADADPQFVVVDTRDGSEHPCRLPPEPAWYRWKTTSGREMSDVGVLQGTYLGVYVGGVCAFWAGKGDRACGFCTTGRNVADSKTDRKSVEDVVETALAAKRESGVTFVHLNAGYSGEHTLDAVEPYIRALKQRVGVLVGVQTTPAKDLTRYDRLKALGVDHLSFCYEFHDPEVFSEHCPGKAHALGQESYFRAIEYCAKLFGRGTCSGEIIAGVEPVEMTLAAIDWITSVGAFPTVCIFRPTAGSRMSNLPSPDPGDMKRVMREVWEACKRHRVPIGLAPNIEVSLIVNPDDTWELVENPDFGDAAWRAALAAARVAARPLFWWKMRPA